jgi:hypothetical protein
MRRARCRKGLFQNFARGARGCADGRSNFHAAIAESPNSLLEECQRFIVAAGKGKKDALSNYDVARGPEPHDAFADGDLSLKIGFIKRKCEE